MGFVGLRGASCGFVRLRAARRVPWAPWASWGSLALVGFHGAQIRLCSKVSEGQDVCTVPLEVLDCKQNFHGSWLVWVCVCSRAMEMANEHRLQVFNDP